MIKRVLLTIIIAFFFTSCSSDYDTRLKISATTWIGYTPLFYAKEKGWLKELNIKLLNVSSLAENMYLYQAGKSDAYVGTQYEYSVLSQTEPSIKPIMMFDRSNGGDIVMSNVSIEELQTSEDSIDAYLEMDSINSTVLKDFISKYKIKSKNINYKNRDQTEIATLDAGSISKKTVVVTYIPYNYQLEERGFKEIASTKGTLDLIVIDAMFTKMDVLNKHKKQFSELKKLVDRSVEALLRDPEEFFKTIQPYMLDMSFDEFKDSLNDIVWINKNMSDELKNRMHDAGLSTRDLM